MTERHIVAGELDVAYLEDGPADGRPVILLHGFPYDVHGYDDVTTRLAGAGLRVLRPWLRAFGATAFLSAETMRSGEQAALAADLLAFINTLALEQPLLVGFDWGGRAACAAAALAPDTIGGIVAIGGDLIQGAPSSRPLPPALAQRLWHLYFLSSPAGRIALEADPLPVCRHLWAQWSPDWAFDDAIFARSAPAFANPDFPAIVQHSYAHRLGQMPGAPAFAALQHRLETLTDIPVPALLLGGADSLAPIARGRFSNVIDTRALTGVGHNVPHEAPEAVAEAVLALAAAVRG